MLGNSTRKKRFANGLCGLCGVVPPRPGLKTCAACGKESSARVREYQKKRIKAGLCQECGGPNVVTKNHCEACRQIKIVRDKAKRKELKEKVYAGYGGYKCACCGETGKHFMTIDHINNDGKYHRRSLSPFRYTRYTYNWLIANNFPEGFQVLCFNCNFGKQANGGICPHKTEQAG